MDERNIISGTSAVAFSGMLDYLYPLRWFALAGLIIVFADLRFGIEAARVRKEVIRRSRAIRRTFNKIVDYTCWILLASSLDHALGEPFNVPILSAMICLAISSKGSASTPSVMLSYTFSPSVRTLPSLS